ncbi:MAG: peptidylprolyl isomerase [Thermoplasmatota archaeon]
MVREVRASHILVESEQEAYSILDQLRAGRPFAALARQYSKCPSGQRGGDLGYFPRGKMVREFEDVAFALQKGQFSGPVQTKFGWHIILVMDRK